MRVGSFLFGWRWRTRKGLAMRTHGSSGGPSDLAILASEGPRRLVPGGDQVTGVDAGATRSFAHNASAGWRAM